MSELRLRTAMEPLSRGRRVPLDEVLSVLEREFDDAEREYDLAYQETTSEDDLEEREYLDNRGEGSDEEEGGDAVSTHPPCVENNMSVEIESSFEDQSEQSKVEHFLGQSCGCKLGPKGATCSSVVSKQAIVQTRNNCLEMTARELDLVIMAQINAQRTHAADRLSSYRGQGDFRPSMKFFFHGVQICQKMFLFLHTIARTRFKSLCSSVSQHGVQERVHGNARKVPHNASSFVSIEHVSRFITNTADTHGLPLPGRLPSCEQKVVVLPSDMTKMSVYKSYKAVCLQEQIEPMQKSAFYQVWQDLHAGIGTMKPATDLCFECQQFMTRIMRSAHLSEDEKSSRLREAEVHLEMARLERKQYNEQITQCKENIAEGEIPQMMHYSFDYAQQVHFPNNPQQPGPAYFLTARKCQVFGVVCEPIGVQVNYLIDENEVIGKGANATISLLHHFLETHGLKEAKLLLHADNCIGQNKNNAVVHYLMWRVNTRRHESAQLSFMLAGHTKFAPDRHFGLFKKVYRRTRVDTISCLQRVVENSSTCGANKAQLIRAIDGTILVKYYDWVEFLKQYYRPIPSISKYHTFIAEHDHGNRIIVKENSTAEEQIVNIGVQPAPEGDFPVQILPKGLDLERKWYLYEKIRPFCSSNLSADLTCPKPTEPKPSSNPAPTPSSPAASAGTKRQRSQVTCSACKCQGHTKRTCPTNK